MDIKTKLALSGQLTQLLADLKDGSLTFEERLNKSKERTELLKKLGVVVIDSESGPALTVEISKNEIHYTPENIELANKVADRFRNEGWSVSVTDNKKNYYSSATIHFSSEKGVGYIGSFSSLKRSLSGDNKGSFALSFSRKLFDNVLDMNVRPDSNLDEQSRRIYDKVMAAYDNPLKSQELTGLGLYSPVNIDGKAYFVGTVLFNDEHVVLYTERDFHSFKFDLDGVEASKWNSDRGEFDYLGKDKPLSMSISELEEKTGRKWGKKRYARKSWAIAQLDTYTRCIVVQMSDGGYWLVPASFVADGPKGAKLIACGKDVPVELVEAKFSQEDDEDIKQTTPRMLLESACVQSFICEPLSLDW